MSFKKLTEERANAIYDLLVSIGGAIETQREDFIYSHCTCDYEVTEWRFCGKLGFGGKYRSTWNGVTYYRENETAEMIKVKEELDAALKKLDDDKVPEE
tara:strand:- start:53 stop:349 length:297 start_codon:yes stop_codon:yes gene_type:complete